MKALLSKSSKGETSSWVRIPLSPPIIKNKLIHPLKTRPLTQILMKNNQGNIFLNTVSWGFVLWLFGYVLGIIFFTFIPKNTIGWAILPFGIIVTLFVLLKKIKRDSFVCYFGLSVIWTLMAVILDFLFLVLLFNSTDYYKVDVYVYYALTFIMPLAVGWYKTCKSKKP